MARRSIAGSRGLLTGASAGIGLALARQLVEGGTNLLAVARRGERLEKLASSLAQAPGRIEIFSGDVTDAQARSAMIARAGELFGGLDLLINNAGSGAMGRFDEADEARLRHVMEINFFAPAELIRLALPLLKAGRQPMVVNVGSVLGHRGAPGCAEYCASKFALRGLSESLRAELSTDGVDLLLVSPARTDTEFFSAAINPTESRWPARDISQCPRQAAGLAESPGAARRGSRHGAAELNASPGGHPLSKGWQRPRDGLC
jgi:short-subunit dehydrogenase